MLLHNSCLIFILGSLLWFPLNSIYRNAVGIAKSHRAGFVGICWLKAIENSYLCEQKIHGTAFHIARRHAKQKRRLSFFVVCALVKLLRFIFRRKETSKQLPIHFILYGKKKSLNHLRSKCIHRLSTKRKKHTNLCRTMAIHSFPTHRVMKQEFYSVCFLLLSPSSVRNVSFNISISWPFDKKEEKNEIIDSIKFWLW